MTETTNYHLKKPAKTDFYNVEDFNANADQIDAVLAAKADPPTVHSVALESGLWTAANTQSVAVAGVQEDEAAQLIFCAPAAASRSEWDRAGVQCVGQEAGTLVFSCRTLPEANLLVFVTIQEVKGE